MSGMFGGGKKVKNSGDFKMTGQAKDAERLLLSQLVGQINGTSPSVANMQYEKAVSDAIKASSAMAASSRGVSNAGLANRNLMNASANIMNDMAGNSALLKLQEQQAAQGQLAQSINAQRGVALQSGIANQQSAIAQQDKDNNFIGNLGTTVAAFSDENLKTNKTKGNALRAVEEFLNSVESYEYNYKGGDEKERLGVMAQDLEKSQIGSQMVKDTPEGKVVDYGQGFSAMMASLAEMNKKIKKLEKK